MAHQLLLTHSETALLRSSSLLIEQWTPQTVQLVIPDEKACMDQEVSWLPNLDLLSIKTCSRCAFPWVTHRWLVGLAGKKLAIGVDAACEAKRGCWQQILTAAAVSQLGKAHHGTRWPWRLW